MHTCTYIHTVCMHVERMLDHRKCEVSIYVAETGVFQVSSVVGHLLSNVGEASGRVFGIKPEEHTIGVTFMVKHAAIEKILTQHRKTHLSPIYL